MLCYSGLGSSSCKNHKIDQVTTLNTKILFHVSVSAEVGVIL